VTDVDPEPGEVATLSVRDLRRIAVLDELCSEVHLAFTAPDRLLATAVDLAHVLRFRLALEDLAVERDVSFLLELEKLAHYVVGLDEKVDVTLDVLEKIGGLGLAGSRGHHRCSERLSNIALRAPRPKDLGIDGHTARYKVGGSLRPILERAEAITNQVRLTGGKDVLEISFGGNGDRLSSMLRVQCLDFKSEDLNVSSLYSVEYLGHILEVLERVRGEEGHMELSFGKDYPLLLRTDWRTGWATVDLANREE